MAILKFKSDTPSGRMFKDVFHGEDMSVERTILILLAYGMEVRTNIVESWTEDQRRHAANWAMREYLRASDNPTVRLVMPEWLEVSG